MLKTLNLILQRLDTGMRMRGFMRAGRGTLTVADGMAADLEVLVTSKSQD
jgi:hypothetical protein